jgi:four helix bundle protein
MGQEEKGFRKLITWQKAYDLVLAVYKITRDFPKEEIYGLMPQMRRAVVSVPANIAEGYERNYKKEYLRFLCIAKGSLGEVETYLLLARDLGYLKKDHYLEIEEKRAETARLLNGLIRSLT